MHRYIYIYISFTNLRIYIYNYMFYCKYMNICICIHYGWNVYNLNKDPNPVCGFCFFGPKREDSHSLKDDPIKPLDQTLGGQDANQIRKPWFNPSYCPFPFGDRHLSTEALNMIQRLAKVEPWNLEEQGDQDCKYLQETLEGLKRCCFR